jgi:hypothetical protein
MKLKHFLSLTAISVLLTSTVLYGQDSEEKFNVRKFGIGLHIEQFKLTDITTNIYSTPPNRIVLTITPFSFIRIEPEIGFNRVKNKDYMELIDKNFVFGIGGYGMIQRGRTNIYGGIKFDLCKISDEYIETYPFSVEKATTDRLAIGPVVGSEYFFGNHFSFGGEVGIKMIKLKTENAQYSGDNGEMNYLTTDTGLFIRFYF